MTSAPEPEPTAEAAPFYKVRVVTGVGNLLHLFARRAPDRLHVRDDGTVDFGPWELIDSPSQAETVLFLRADAVAGVTFRVAASPRQIAQALGEPKRDPEDEPGVDVATLIACPRAECAVTNIVRRRRCRACGCSLTAAKPRAPRKSRARAEGDASAEKAPRKRRDRTGEHARALRQCAKCGSVTPHSEAKKTHRCSSCNHLF